MTSIGSRFGLRHEIVNTCKGTHSTLCKQVNNLTGKRGNKDSLPSYLKSPQIKSVESQIPAQLTNP